MKVSEYIIIISQYLYNNMLLVHNDRHNPSGDACFVQCDTELNLSCYICTWKSYTVNRGSGNNKQLTGFVAQIAI